MAFGVDDLLIASFATQAFGSILGGQASAQSSEYKAQVDAQNAQAARDQGNAAVAALGRDFQRTQGRALANYGASGVQTDNGSPLDVLADSASMFELDKLTTKYKYELQALGYSNQEQLDKSSAQNATTAGLLNAGAYALRAGSVYSRYNGTPIPSLGSSSGAAGGDAILWDGAGSIGGSEAAAVALA